MDWSPPICPPLALVNEVFWILTPILVLAPGAVLVVCLLVVKKREKLRTEQIEKISNKLNLNFSPKGDDTILDRMKGFPLHSLSTVRRIRNLCHGTTDGMEVAIFDYHLRVNEKRTDKQTVILFHSPKLNFPPFQLRPEKLVDKIEAAVGYQDIDFDKSPGFSSRYLLRGQDEEAIRKLFQTRALNYFVSHELVWVEGVGNSLIAYRSRQRIEPEKFSEFMTEGIRLLQSFSHS